MPKLTRAGKSLATTLVAALTVGFFGVAPAHAVDLISLDPSVGTTTTTLIGSPITLTTSVGASINGNPANKLMYAVSNPSGATISAKFATGDDTLATVDFGVGTTGDGARVGDTSTATSFVIDPTLVADTGVAPAHNYAYTNPLTDKTKVNNLQLNTTSTETVSFSVYAFVDSNSNGKYDAGTEYASATRTITMKKLSEVTAAATMVQPDLGGTKLQATVALDNDVNVAVVAGRLTVQFSKDGSAIGSPVSTTWNDTTKKLEAAVDPYSVLPGTYGAQAKIDATNSGVASYKVLAGGTIGSIDAATSTAGENVRAGTGGEGTYVLRATTAKTVPVSIQVKNTVGTAIGAGIAVTVKVAKTTLDATTTITAGGKSLTATTTDGYVTFDTVTDADGKVIFTLASTTAKAGDKVAISATGNGTVAKINSAAIVSYEWKAATASTIVDLGGPIRSIVKTGAVSIDYGVTDDFGKMVTADGYRIAATLSVSASGATLIKQALVSGGKATLSWTDNSTSTGMYIVSANLEKLNTDTGNYESLGKTPTASQINVLASVTPAAVTITPAAVTGLTVEPKDFVAVDTRVDSSITAPAYTNGTNLTGSVTLTGGAVLPGVPVTLSAKGLAFSYNGLYTIDSITVYTDAAGNFGTVKVYSHTSGKVTITATSGGVSGTKDMTWNYTGVPVKLVVDGLAVAQAQNSTEITATLTDKWGNPVADSSADFVKFALSGVGTLDGNAVVYTRTDKDGKATVRLVTGANDEGTATITVSVPTVTDLAAVTKAVKVTKFGYAAVEAAKIAVTTEANVRSGTSTYVTILVTDKDGKAVADSGRDYMTVTLTGAGTFEGGLTTAYAKTDKDGKAVLRIIAGAQEAGTATVSVAIPSVAALAAATGTITFGDMDGSFGKSAGKLLVKYSFAKGKTVKVYVDGKLVKSMVPTTNDPGTHMQAVKKGKHTVRVVLGSMDLGKKVIRF